MYSLTYHYCDESQHENKMVSNYVLISCLIVNSSSVLVLSMEKNVLFSSKYDLKYDLSNHVILSLSQSKQFSMNHIKSHQLFFFFFFFLTLNILVHFMEVKVKLIKSWFHATKNHQKKAKTLKKSEEKWSCNIFVSLLSNLMKSWQF